MVRSLVICTWYEFSAMPRTINADHIHLESNFSPDSSGRRYQTRCPGLKTSVSGRLAFSERARFSCVSFRDCATLVSMSPMCDRNACESSHFLGGSYGRFGAFRSLPNSIWYGLNPEIPGVSWICLSAAGRHSSQFMPSWACIFRSFSLSGCPAISARPLAWWW